MSDELIASLTGMVKPKRSVNSRLGEQYSYDSVGAPGEPSTVNVADTSRGMEANVAEADSMVDEGTVAKAAAGKALGFNPWVMGAQVGLSLLKNQAQMREKERMERYQAQENTKSSMSSALSKLTSIGAALKL
jgi:hypothetical protein